MRIVRIWIVLCLITVIARSQENAQATSSDDDKDVYICRMYCTDDVSSTPANCRACGMKMELRSIVENPADYKIIRPQAALDRIRKKNNGLLLLDVRSKEEYNDELGHLENSIQIPIKEFDARVGELARYKDKTIIVYCSHGLRSASVAKSLTKQGYTVFSLMGGLTKWNREHFPVVRK